MKRNIPDGAHAFVTDVTSGYGQLNVQGPRSRELLQSLTSADLSNAAFPFRAAREIDIGYARVLCTRITYLGELGYELFIPTDQAVHVYDQVVAAGEKFGVVHAGLRALGSLRMEKGYRDYGHDLDNTDDPYETGPWLCSRPEEARWLHRQGSAVGAQGEGSTAAAPGVGPGQGSGAADVPRRDRAPRRQGRGLRARCVIRPHARRRCRTGIPRTEADRGRGVPGVRYAGKSRSPASDTRPSFPRDHSTTRKARPSGDSRTLLHRTDAGSRLSRIPGQGYVGRRMSSSSRQPAEEAA